MGYSSECMCSCIYECVLCVYVFCVNIFIMWFQAVCCKLLHACGMHSVLYVCMDAGNDTGSYALQFFCVLIEAMFLHYFYYVFIYNLILSLFVMHVPD